MESDRRALLDLDHVVTEDGKIYRVLGNLDSRTHFLGYNVYSPHPEGDRFYRNARYRKNFIEDERLPADVLDTYTLVPVQEVAEHHDPIRSAIAMVETFRSTVWFDLYTELVKLVGPESVGIFGSSMFGLHLTPRGTVRKDVDFVIQDLANVEVLRKELPGIRDRLGFTTVTAERQIQQYERYRRVFRNDNNSIRSIIARRWTGLQLSNDVVTTIRVRDRSQTTPAALIAPTPRADHVPVSGRVTNASRSTLFPRRFDLVTGSGIVEIYVLWWKFSTPVQDGDAVTVRGSLLPANHAHAIRLTDYSRHWLRIDD